LKIGDMVLLKEDNVPPCSWPIARVIEVFPGADGLVRNIKIRTAKSTLTRPRNKVVHLFSTDSSSADSAAEHNQVIQPSRADSSNVTDVVSKQAKRNNVRLKRADSRITKDVNAKATTYRPS